MKSWFWLLNFDSKYGILITSNTCSSPFLKMLSEELKFLFKNYYDGIYAKNTKKFPAKLLEEFLKIFLTKISRYSNRFSCTWVFIFFVPF